MSEEVLINTVLEGTPRRCTVLRHFTNVQTVHLTELNLPRASFISSVRNPVDTTNDISVPAPVEIIVEMQPSGQQQIHGTDKILNNSNFICSQVHESDTHILYETKNTKLIYDTPLNYLSNLTFKLRNKQDAFQINAFNPLNSPDTQRITDVEYLPDTNTTRFTLRNSPDRYKVGDVVSFRDISVLKPTVNMTNEEKKWYNALILMYGHNVIIAEINTTMNTVTVLNNLLQINDKLPDINVALQTDPSLSILLNESMQYNILLRFDCLEKRLVQQKTN